MIVFEYVAIKMCTVSDMTWLINTISYNLIGTLAIELPILFRCHTLYVFFKSSFKNSVSLVLFRLNFIDICYCCSMNYVSN